MVISIIAAIAKNRVIGKNNKLPWNLPADLQHFKDLTLGKPVIMGQRTFESIGKPLPGRTNIVLSLDENFNPSGCIVARSIEEALKAAGSALAETSASSARAERRARDERSSANPALAKASAKELMICGGASIYKQFLPLANKMYLTLIDAEFEGDAYFPKFDWQDWEEKERIENQPDEENPYKYTFITLERKKLIQNFNLNEEGPR